MWTVSPTGYLAIQEDGERVEKKGETIICLNGHLEVSLIIFVFLTLATRLLSLSTPFEFCGCREKQSVIASTRAGAYHFFKSYQAETISLSTENRYGFVF